MLGFMNEPDDFLQGALTRRTEHHDFHDAPKIDRAREHRVAQRFLHRRRFAGEIGFVAGGFAFDNFGVHREQRAGFDQQALSRAQPIHRHFAFVSFSVHQGGHLGRGAKQGADFPLGSAHGVMLQGPGRRKQEKQHGPFRPRAHRRAARRNREHEKMNVERPGAQFAKGFLRGEPGARKTGNRVERHRPRWLRREIAGQSEERA